MQFNKDDYILQSRPFDGPNSRVDVPENQQGQRIVKKTIKDITKYTIRETNIAEQLQLSQENIVTFYHIEIDRNKNQAYIFMEQCDKDLSKYQKEIEQQKTELDKKIEIIVNIAIHIVQGYQYLIKKFPAFMHRDIKPQNIFVKGDIWKIGDFGCSKIESDILQTGNIGTKDYLAPEVIKGQMYDNKCDIYSLGILMHQFVYGTTKVDCQKIQNSNFRSLLYQMTYKDPSRRPDWFQIDNHLQQLRRSLTMYQIRNQPVLISAIDFEMQILKAQPNMSNYDSYIQHYELQDNIINLNKLFANVAVYLEPDEKKMIKTESQICFRAVFQLQLRVYELNLRKYIKKHSDMVEGLNEQKRLVQWQQLLRLQQYSTSIDYNRNIEFYDNKDLIKIIAKHKDQDKILQKFSLFVARELEI